MAAPLLAPADWQRRALRAFPAAFLIVAVVGAALILSVAAGEPIVFAFGLISVTVWLGRHRVHRLAG